jgi:hypothetical protein
LANFLLESLDDTVDASAELDWEKEIAARVADPVCAHVPGNRGDDSVDCRRPWQATARLLAESHLQGWQKHTAASIFM